jgi:hypothetical protein
MMNFRLIGAAALSLVLTAPAMAMQHRYQHDDSQAAYGELPVQDALEYGNGSTYGAYNFSPRDDSFAEHEGRSDFPRYNPVPPSAHGG